MKNLSLFVLLLISQSVFALNYGECFGDVNSKKYFDTDFSASYPREVKFTCAYNCFGEDGYVQIIGTHKLIVRNLSDDAKRVVCQGVQVSRRSWGYDYDRTEAFYGHEASAAEVKEWAVKNVQRENSIEKALLLELKEKLSQVASGYMMASTSGAQFNYFKVADEYLIEIAKGLPEDTRKLDLAVKKYQHMSSQSVNDADKLILGVINSTAKFRFN